MKQIVMISAITLLVVISGMGGFLIKVFSPLFGINDLDMFQSVCIFLFSGISTRLLKEKKKEETSEEFTKDIYIRLILTLALIVVLVLIRTIFL